MTLAADRLDRLRALEERQHFWAIGRDRLTTEVINRYSMRAPFVDAGAGTGVYARCLETPNVWFDAGPVDTGGLRANVLAMPFSSGSVGTVLLRDVIEHVDDSAALGEAFRVLRPGGHLLLTVPGWPSLWGPRDVAAGHLRRYRRRPLRRLAESAGFTVAEMRGYQFALLPAVVAVRTIARLTGDERPEREEDAGRLNQFLTRVNLAEARLARRRRPAPPTGSSLVLVGVKS